jgi:hypothetical protein
MTDQNNAAQAANKEIDAIMEQAQVFASAWAFYGGPFDQGDGKEHAEREEAKLRDVIRDALSKLRAEGVQAGEPLANTVVRQCPRCTGNGTILRLSGNGPDAYDVQEECSHCEGSGVASAPVAGEALFWYRPRSDGSYEGPIHNDHIEDVRRRSGAWLPLLPTPQFSAAQDTPTDADLNACFPASLGPGGEWALKGARIALARYGHTAPKATKAERIVFPAHLRKMWSGGEVQAWLDNHQGITPPKASAKGSMERYRKWQSEQTQADKDGCANG